MKKADLIAKLEDIGRDIGYILEDTNLRHVVKDIDTIHDSLDELIETLRNEEEPEATEQEKEEEADK